MCSTTNGDGEFVKECMDILVENICPKNVHSLPIYRCLGGQYFEAFVRCRRTFKTVFGNASLVFSFFSLALDEKTDASDTAQLAVFICSIYCELTVNSQLVKSCYP